MMSQNVYLANSYPWLARRLLAGPSPDPGVAVMVDSRADADVIIYPSHDLSEAGASDHLRDFSLRELLRTCVFSQLDEPFPWAPGMYASMPAGYAKPGLVGGFYVVQQHHEEGGIVADLEAARGLEVNLLWSFVGTISNHPVRGRLRELGDDASLVRDTQTWSDKIRWKWRGEHHREARRAFTSFAETMGHSAFVLCPRGRGPGSIRLFEALQVGRVPVIVSDEWLPTPFVDWESCSIRVAERDIEHLPCLLRERKPEAGEMGRRARLEWERHFAPERQLSTLVAGCLHAAAAARNRPLVAARAAFRPQSLRRGLRVVKQKATR